MLKHLSQLEEMLSAYSGKRRLGVVNAGDNHTIEAVVRAEKAGLIESILFGEKKKITSIWEQIAGSASLPEIIDPGGTEYCISQAFELVHEGKLDCLMKGNMETGVLMKAVVDRERGIRRSDTLSLIAVMESPYYHKLFAITDVGLLISPQLEQKKEMIKNAVGVFHSLGITEPKVAVLGAVEKPNTKMPETIDAEALKLMFQKGELPGCIVEGPISYDLCMDRNAAAIKGYESPVAGDPDILIVPNIISGNLLAKSLTCTGNAKTCGIVIGAMVPIVLTSRSAPADDKYMSIVLSALAGNESRTTFV
jgi:phosphotransacetylase